MVHRGCWHNTVCRPFGRRARPYSACTDRRNPARRTTVASPCATASSTPVWCVWRLGNGDEPVHPRRADRSHRRTPMSRLMLALVMAVAVAAPVAASAARKDAVPPTPCTVQPRTEAEVAALVAAATATPGAAAGRDPDGWADRPADLPQGEPADPETVAAVTAAAREFAGCLNATDFPRWLALMTDRLLPEAVGSFGMAALFEATGT